MAQKKQQLPKSCAECVFRKAETGTCHRHAPSTTTEEFDLTYWPRVRAQDRCGVGSSTGPQPVSCGWCIHWWQPNGLPPEPPFKRGRSAEWWRESGFCTRFAPSPSGEEDRKTFWRITHARDSCGDGEQIKDETSSEITPQLAF